MRVGVVGAGWFASRRHLPELVAHPDVELVALCRRSPEPLALLAQHFGVPQTYTDYDQMLAQAELDAVLVCSTHDLHHDHSISALEAGCHVLLEKPMALTTADAEDLVTRFAAAGRVLEVAYNPPYWRHDQWLRDRVLAGDFGEMETVTLRASGNGLLLFGEAPMPDSMPGLVKPTTYRGDVAANGGGHLADGGCHPVAEVLWVTGQQPVTVSADLDHVPADRRYSVNVTLSGGGYASLVSITNSARTDRQSFGLWTGTSASALVRGLGVGFEILWTPSGGEPTWVREDEMPTVPQPVGSFVDAVLGRAEPRCPGSACIDYVRVIEAAYCSAATGERQNLGAPPVGAPGSSPAC